MWIDILNYLNKRIINTKHIGNNLSSIGLLNNYLNDLKCFITYCPIIFTFQFQGQTILLMVILCDQSKLRGPSVLKIINSTH